MATPRRHRRARPPRNRRTADPEPWMWDAACAHTPDPDIFYPKDHRDPAIEQAKAVCSQCPVKADCRQYALDTKEEHGIWGGLDEWERQALLAEQQQDKHDQADSGVA